MPAQIKTCVRYLVESSVEGLLAASDKEAIAPDFCQSIKSKLKKIDTS